MPLKNKDGTPYRVMTEPNPLVKDQESWRGDVVYHNFEPKTPDTTEDKHQILPVQTDLKITETPVLEPPPEPAPLDEHKSEPPDEHKSEPLPEPVPEPIPEVMPAPVVPSEEPSEFLIRNSITTWCLPALDTGKWGEKFTFECVFIEEESFTLKIWTTVGNIGKESIIYPSRYTHTQKSLESYRWWRVTNLTPMYNGQMIEAIPSNQCPDFA